MSVSRADDPLVAIVLWAIAGATAAALIGIPYLTDVADKDVRDAVLKVAGGVILLLSSYFAARTLKQSRADQRIGRILQAAELLAAASPSVRAGALGVLVNLAESSKGRREAEQVALIQGILQAMATDESGTEIRVGGMLREAEKRVEQWTRRNARAWRGVASPLPTTTDTS